MNVLIQGTHAFIEDTLRVLRRDIDRRQFSWPWLPDGRHTPSATLLVREVGELPADARDALAGLTANTHPPVQVVVTSSANLFELVARGQFPADLYYRLNIVTLTDDDGVRSAGMTLMEPPFEENLMETSAFRQQVAQERPADDIAAAWQKHFPQMREQMAAVTNALVDAAEPQPGMRVLDLASGNGEPALSLAARVFPNGHVTATDVNEEMLSALRANAEADHVTNIETKACDAHELPFADGSFDLVTSRFGVMFFADTPAALREIKRVLKSDGRVAFLVWGPDTYFGTAELPSIRRLATEPDLDVPGPMPFAESRKLATVLEGAGFVNVEERSASLPAAYRGAPQELLTSMMELAVPLRKTAAALSEDRTAAEQEALNNLGAVFHGNLTEVTAPVIIVIGTRS